MRDENRVAVILADWIGAREDGEALDFEVLVQEHPELEEDLRRGLAAMALMDFALDKPGTLETSVPETVGAYRVLGVLGDGGMGTVYKAVAEQEGTLVPEGTTVAVKCVHPHLLKTPGFQERFQREAELLLY